MQEKIIQTKTCKHCNSNFEITDRDLLFYDKISPVFNWKKYQIPSPNLCPDCRQQSRLLWKNDSHLYKRKCDATGKNILSIYSPDKDFKVYSNEIWMWDTWNSLDYWRDFDFNGPFFEQFNELLKVVPRQNIFLDNSCENSNYSNSVYWCKDCYLLFSSGSSKKCCFWTRINYSENCFDSLLLKNCNDCYECIEVFSSNKCQFSRRLSNCNNCIFCFDCDWCDSCFMSANLKNKKYCIYNKQYTKQEYEDKIKELNLWHYNFLQDRKNDFKDYLEKQIHRNQNVTSSENTIGDNIKNSKDSYCVFDWSDLEDVKYSYFVDDVKDSADVNYWIDNTTLNYYTILTWINAHNILFCIDVWPNVSNLIYCENCNHWVSNCFWCTGLKWKEYCILNKQYTKQEYEELVSKIIEHMQKTWEWWEFFPSYISPFGYNETIAQEYFPLTPPSVPPLSGDESKMFRFSLSPGREKMSEGQIGVFNWSTYEPPKPNVEKIIPANKLPDEIKDIPDDILNWAIKCEVTDKPFRITKQELDFYRKHNLPIPRKHPDQRHIEKMQQRNPRKLFDRKCDKCWIDMKTTYASDRPEVVYCEKCYEKEVY